MKLDAEKLRVTLGRIGPAYPTHKSWMLVSISPDDLSRLREAAQDALKVQESGIVELIENRIQMGQCTCTMTIRQDCNWHQWKAAYAKMEREDD